MALSDPKIPYISIRNTILSLLKTNVATLNANLSTLFNHTDRQIRKGDLNVIPTRATTYPYIFVRISNKVEDFTSLGGGGRKLPIITYIIQGACKKMNNSAEDDDEAYRLAENLESIFRDNINLGHARVVKSEPTNTEFNSGEFDKGVYVSAVSFELDVMVDII